MQCEPRTVLVRVLLLPSGPILATD